MSEVTVAPSGAERPRPSSAFRRQTHLATSLMKGLATHVPGVRALAQKRSRGSDSPRYCYSVWLRHLELARKNGLCLQSPARVAELGPGDTLGVGIAALLCGAESYRGLDVVHYATNPQNLAVFDELVTLFERRADIPGPDEFPAVKPTMEGYGFPHAILGGDHMARCLAPDRVARLRKAVETEDESVIAYVAPWQGAAKVQPGAVDMLLSQAVMQYVPDLPGIYAELAQWLAPGGFSSHQIDFKSHGFASDWNGHWRYSDTVWNVMKGKRAYTLNRAPYSAHAAAIRAAGLEIVNAQTGVMESALSPSDLAPRFREMSYEDLRISGACIQARKPLA